MIDKIYNDIARVLILSRFEEKFGQGETANEIVDFEKRAIEYYQGRYSQDRSYEGQFEQTQFHARIQRDMAHIIKILEEFEDGIHDIYREQAEMDATS